MDHSHHDRTYKKSRFQQELEQSVSRKLISSLLLGCLLFCIAIAVVNALNQNARREDHLESVTSTFHEVYDNTSAFLLDAGHTELFLSELRKDQDNLRYLISHYNVSALVEIQLILTDSEGNVRFTTFSEGEMNLHRQEFNCIAVDNACHLMRAVYTTVYHFRANSSEYVMIHPLYRDGEYQGAAAVYLNENDWTKLFSQYQYDAILTKSNGDVITCSNSSFLSQKNANKYLPADAAQYVRVNGNRYLRSSRSLENGTVLAYSFIYSPTNYSYLFVGLLLIVLLGLSWAAMFARIMHAMTEQMVKSVDTLVREIRIIRKEDPDHIIEIDTGDEIEEIARQVNKMVRSIQELSQRNIALAEVNNRMEMQNLQAQINPHFIYNTLDNIRTGEWSREIAKKAEIPFSLLPTPYDPCDIVGGVTEEAAHITGLKAGTPVSAGCLDSVVATLGAGAVQEGDVALTIGSSGRICYIGSEPIYDKRLLNCRSPYQGLYTILQTTDNAGISLRWFRDVFGDAVQQKAEAAGLSVYDYMNTLAEKVPAGCNGLVYLPYLAGEKSPIWDSDARGVFFGMSLSTDYGAFVRAIMEGVALSMRDCMEIMPAAKKSISPIPLGGGAANSRVWCQIFADVLNRPIVRLKSGETETLGDFIIAAESVGLTDVTRNFGKKLAAESEVLYPDSAAASVYDKAYQKYKAVYQNTKTLF